MIRILLKAPAYIFHPLFMPLLGTIIYFLVTPRYSEIEVIEAILFSVAILTFLIPIISFFLLKNLGAIETIHLKTTRERRFPLMFQCVLLLLIIKLVFNPFDNPELYYFFVAILFSSISAFILLLFKIKASLHLMGVAGVTAFMMLLSIHFNVNMLIGISFMLFVNGWVASSRLYTEAHTGVEILFGIILGAIPQFLLISFWL